MPSGNFLRGFQIGFGAGNKIMQTAMQREMFELQKANMETPEQRRERDRLNRLTTYEEQLKMAEAAEARGRQTRFENIVDLHGMRPQIPGMPGMEPDLPAGQGLNPDMTTYVDPLWEYEEKLKLAEKYSPKGGGAQPEALSEADKQKRISTINDIIESLGVEGANVTSLPSDVSALVNRQLDGVWMLDANGVPVDIGLSQAIDTVYGWHVLNNEQVGGYIKQIPATEESNALKDSILLEVDKLVRGRAPIDQISVEVRNMLYGEREQITGKDVFGGAPGAVGGTGRGLYWLWDRVTGRWPDWSNEAIIEEYKRRAGLEGGGGGYGRTSAE